MYIIKNICDIRRLKVDEIISVELAQHYVRKLNALKEAFKPEIDLEDFSLEQYGAFGLLEKGDKNITAIGLPEELAEIMPEWISRLEIPGNIYYILYIMADNDHVVQIYLPDSIMEETIRLWLSAQPIEEEEGSETNGEVVQLESL